jgi:hypothetical protein
METFPAFSRYSTISLRQDKAFLVFREREGLSVSVKGRSRNAPYLIQCAKHRRRNDNQSSNDKFHHEKTSAAEPQSKTEKSPAKTPRRNGRLNGNEFVWGRVSFSSEPGVLARRQGLNDRRPNGAPRVSRFGGSRLEARSSICFP